MQYWVGDGMDQMDPEYNIGWVMEWIRLMQNPILGGCWNGSGGPGMQYWVGDGMDQADPEYNMGWVMEWIRQNRNAILGG
jgi:hypothetical protein